jgi:hypothetical protein
LADLDIKLTGSLLNIAVTGPLSADEIISVMRGHYVTGVQNVIWDITGGSVFSITNDGFKRIAKAALELMSSGVRQGGKTVYVGSADVEYGMMNMYVAFAEMAGVPIEYKTVRTYEDALVWLHQV